MTLVSYRRRFATGERACPSTNVRFVAIMTIVYVRGKESTELKANIKAGMHIETSSAKDEIQDHLRE